MRGKKEGTYNVFGFDLFERSNKRKLFLQLGNSCRILNLVNSAQVSDHGFRAGTSVTGQFFAAYLIVASHDLALIVLLTELFEVVPDEAIARAFRLGAGLGSSFAFRVEPIFGIGVCELGGG